MPITIDGTPFSTSAVKRTVFAIVFCRAILRQIDARRHAHRNTDQRWPARE